MKRHVTDKYIQTPLFKMKTLIEKINIKLLPFFVLLGTFFAVVSHIETGTWGINKTVGWAWDFSPIGWLIFMFSSIAFFFFYLILKFLKSKPNQTLSIIQALLFIIIVGLQEKLGNSSVCLLNLLTGIVFLLNVVVTLTRKRKIDDPYTGS